MKETGFAAMGKPVPYNRRQAAYDAARSMGLDEPFTMIEGMCEALKHDRPYEAIQVAMEYVDLIGAYRLVAHLLTEGRA